MPPEMVPMTDAEREASHRAYLACKPALDAALAKIDARSVLATRPIHARLPERIKTGPNIGYACQVHHYALDPWGHCHHGCPRCEREAPYQRIWTHKGGCRAGGGGLVKLT